MCVSIFSTLLSGCETDNPAQLPEMFNRGIDYNISEEQLITQESGLTFETIDLGYERVLTSNEAIILNDEYAYVSYTFINDKLKIIDYKIDVVYPKSQIDDILAYQIYDNYKQLLTDIYGAPEQSDFEESDYFETYSLQWAKNVITPRLYVIQTTTSSEYFAYPSEIEDYVQISFVYRENFAEQASNPIISSS